jgi:hypothetical protein
MEGLGAATLSLDIGQGTALDREAMLSTVYRGAWNPGLDGKSLECLPTSTSTSTLISLGCLRLFPTYPHGLALPNSPHRKAKERCVEAGAMKL